MIKDLFYWLEDKTGIDANTTATLLVSFIVFGLGLFTTSIANKLKKDRNRKQLAISYSKLYKDFASSCKTYSKAITKSLNLASLKDNKDLILRLPNIGSLDYLVKIDLADLLTTFIHGKNKRLKSFAVTTLYEAVAKIKRLHTQGNSMLDNLGKEMHGFESEYRKHLKSIVAMHDSLLATFNIGKVKLTHESFEYGFIVVFQSFLSDAPDKGSLYNTYNYLIIPLEQLISKYNNNPDSLILQKPVIECKSAYLNFVKNYDFLVEEYTTYAIISNKAARNIEVALSLFTFHKVIKKFSIFYSKVKPRLF